MARLVVVAALSAMVGALAGAACSIHADEDQDDPTVQQTRDRVDDVLDCLSWEESRDNPSAYNPKSGAAGQFQFIRSTWLTTPQGLAGLSIWDPVAQRSAARWMIEHNRLREWATWPLCA